jgi:TRAP-type C4-dicarboxylate transport system permease small subunit
MINFFALLLDRLSRLHVALICAALILMLALNTWNILWRSIYDTEPGPILPWTMVLFVWMIFLGFFPLLHEGRDVSLEYFKNRLGTKGQSLLEWLADLCALFTTGVILSQSVEAISSQVGRIPMVGFDRYWLSLPLILSCAFIFLDVIVRRLARPSRGN